jgi:hypothetical protein
VVEVEICEHEIIVISLLAINISGISPAFGVITKYLVNCGLVVISIIIGAGKMIPVVFLLRILVPSCLKVET